MWVLSLIGTCLLLWLTYALKEIVVLLVVGYCLSYAIEPIISYFEKRLGISRSRGILLVAVLALIILCVLLITAIPPLLREGQSLIENLPEYTETVREKVEPLLGEIITDTESPLYDLVQSPLNVIRDLGKDVLPKVISGISSVLLSGYSVTLTLLNLTLLPFIVFYLSVDFPSIKEGFLRIFRTKTRKNVASILEEIDRYTSSFVRGQIIVCTVLFVLYALGLGLLGVELWLVLAFIAGYGNLIPYLGFLLGIVLTSIMAVVTFGDFTHLFFVWGIFAVVQFLEGTFITPKIIGSSVGLSPLVVILAIVAGGSLFGLLGIFLAVPGAAVLKVLIKHLYHWALRQAD